VRRAFAIAVVLVMLPASTAIATDLDQILEESKDASYSAEQVITCSTPDGVRDAVVELSQASGELHIGAPVAPDVEVASGFGGWSLVRDGDVVSSANVDDGGETPERLYAVDEGEPTDYLGREATIYEMTADGVVRAEMVVDSESGALLRVVTFNADGSVFCERRFVTFNPDAPTTQQAETAPEGEASEAGVDSDLPETLGGFQRLDVYRDEDGILFAYYSDGFFSFAVFQTPTLVVLDGGSSLTVGDGAYTRSFGPGQVTYAWETRGGAMALIGDLPPDMHEEVLQGLPEPQDPGLWRRVWRNLFGDTRSSRPL
jgi:outer membrane lipoprotein-sorting protein